MGKRPESVTVVQGDAEYLTETCLRKKRGRKSPKVSPGTQWLLLQRFSVAHLTFLLESLRIALVFCLDPGRPGLSFVNVFGSTTRLKFEKCIFNGTGLFVFFLVNKLI